MVNIIQFKKTLFTLSLLAGFASFSGIVANADSYTVKSGDTVAKIASKHHDSIKGIAKRNHLANQNLIIVGQKLDVQASSKKANSKQTAVKSEKKAAFTAHADVKKTSSSDNQSTANATSSATTTPAQFQSQGVIYQNGKKWTYYTGAAFADGTTNHGGYDADGYLIVAAPSNVAFGTHVQTPLGEGVVHDRGTAIVGNHYDLVMP
ncbi:LysM peptidoglycan-binding domain-containing protein [Lentilactobacillus parafarraginis]|uniref:LysM domain protein n=2 Tax=Lentilactobacillus parafarraginis TaxID=390842 RepID=A0A0R1YGV1_9LACO|nr:LysM peptidoglycan-binding domain-containing protein [Lentilactobacillus parafarraginis]KRM41742.1 LysM domain protein [Lentilactobacillus parafarraginis DSM 18390 = JCM 14109]TLQ19053.1 LysM peptidoglycan-binding domain-containing protein [Lentilactobacillus parafarraginis]